MLVGGGPLPKRPYVAAVVVGLLAGTLMGLATERMIARPLFRQPKVTLVVATAGVALLAIAVEGFFAGAEPKNFPPLIKGDLFNAGSLRVTNQGALIVVVLGILAAASALFF